MKRIWNALRYGDWETRKCIGSVMLFGILAVVFMIILCITGKIYWVAFALIAAVIAFIISRTFSLVDEDYVAEVNRKGKKETVKSASAKINKIESAKFDHYNPKILKRVKKQYRIKKDHRPIIIDYSEAFRIKECPAFIWRAHDKVYLLLLEQEPRRICLPREVIKHMGYKPGVRVNQQEEYKAFQKDNLVTSVYEPYLPDYFDSKVKNDPLKCKNLYTIYPDIQITNRSAHQVLDLLALNFMPKDKITESEKINGFFKRIYAANILYRDKVYSITEYKEAVEKALNDMCYAEVPQREFIITLENLVNARLISQQYADYYFELKEKIVRKQMQAEASEK